MSTSDSDFSLVLTKASSQEEVSQWLKDSFPKACDKLEGLTGRELYSMSREELKMRLGGALAANLFSKLGKEKERIPKEEQTLRESDLEKLLRNRREDIEIRAPQQITSPAFKKLSSIDNSLIQSGNFPHSQHVAVDDSDEVEPPLTSSLGLAKREKDRLEGEKRILMDECARVKQEKQKIKEESFEIDEQLISAMEQLSAYERQQALMEERHNALLREARLLEEDNLAMKAVINEKDIKSAGDCETIRQLKVDVQFNNDKIEQMREEKERLVAKCSDLEQRCATSDQIEVFKAEELEQIEQTKRIAKELAIFRSDNEKFREKDIPSLLQDIEELKQLNKATSEQYQKELKMVKNDRDHLERDLQMIRGFLNLDGGEKKPIDKSKGSEPETRDSMNIMDQLSRHFEECSHALKKLVQLLKASVNAKESQLDRRSKELRDARNRNDFLVQEVFTRGEKINQLTERVKTMVTMPAALTPQN